jgi:hypothetical protein
VACSRITETKYQNDAQALACVHVPEQHSSGGEVTAAVARLRDAHLTLVHGQRTRPAAIVRSLHRVSRANSTQMDADDVDRGADSGCGLVLLVPRVSPKPKMLRQAGCCRTGRGRNGSCLPTPTQSRTCGTTAYGSCLGYVTQSDPQGKGVHFQVSGYRDRQGVRNVTIEADYAGCGA